MDFSNDLSLTEDHKRFIEHFQKFSNEVLRPLGEKAEREEKYPLEVYQKMAEQGYLGISFPEKYGGAAMDHVALALMFEELGSVSASLTLGIYCHMVLSLTPFHLYGSEEQKQRYLIPGIQGKKIGAWGITEPSAGSDLAAIQSRADLQGNEYVINGSKIFTTNGTFADYVVITAYTQKAAGMKGITLFVVDKGTPGFHVARRIKTVGVRGSETTELVFENCRVPKSQILGEVDKGFYNALNALTGGRIVAASFAIGLARAAMEQGLKYTKERKQFGKPIFENQGVSWAFSDMATTIEAARLLTHKAARLADAGKPHIKEASMAKLFATENASKICAQAMQLHGGYGLTEEFPAEKFFRDAKLLEIGEGTNQIHRNMIAKFL